MVEEVNLIVPEDDTKLPLAEKIAQANELSSANLPPRAGYYFSLGDVLKIRQVEEKGDFYIDFCSGELHHRALYGANRSSSLAKAIGARSRSAAPRVLDATAGLAQDAFVLAALGCHVTMLERSSVISLLIADALERSKKTAEIRDITDRLELIKVDAREYLKKLPPDNNFDVIYLDPMFPHEKRSALVKKRMRICRDIVGDDLDAKELFEAAMSTSVKRIVVKRMKTAPFIGDIKPLHHVVGKTNRYDVYVR